jgi:hypothetical protein
MGLFNRIRPTFEVPPTEPTSVQAAVAGIDIQLAEIAGIPRDVRGDGLDWRADVLLDKRNTIRKARPAEVPVVPGYVDARAENYWRNP